MTMREQPFVDQSHERGRSRPHQTWHENYPPLGLSRGSEDARCQPAKPEALSFRSRFIGEESASGGSTTDSSRDVTALRNDNAGAAVRGSVARARTLAPTSNMTGQLSTPGIESRF